MHRLLTPRRPRLARAGRALVIRSLHSHVCQRHMGRLTSGTGNPTVQLRRRRKTMRSAGALPLLLSLLLTAGCYHQVVHTGATAGPRIIEHPWTATYLFGLIPAAEISTVAQCPNGVAVIETQQTFLNGLVGVVTLGIYTPQTVRITCAAGGDASVQGARTVRVAD